MAIAKTAVWRIRPGGNNANGSGYDGTSYPGGTDYSQQDAAQAVFGDLACASTATTLTSASAQFTAAMVGNAIQISGGANAATGWYFVTAVGSATSVTLDRTPTSGGALSGGAGRLGGAVGAFEAIMGNNTSHPVQPGNTVYVRGSGSDSPSVADYTPNAYVNCYGGDSVTGPIRILSENGRPRFEGNFTFYGLGYVAISGMMFVAGGTVANGGQGILLCYHSRVRDCVFDGKGYDVALINTDFVTVTECEFFHSTSSGTIGSKVNAQGTRRCLFMNNHFHDIPGDGLNLDAGYPAMIIGNVFANLAGNAITIPNAGEHVGIIGNTFTGNGGHGLNISNSDGYLDATEVVGNLFANHTGVGKAGIAVAGTQATNDTTARGFVGNAFYNNTMHVSGLSSIGPASQVLGADPFTAVATEDLTPTFTPSFPAGPFKQRTAGKTTTMEPSQGQGAVGAAAGAAAPSGPTLSLAEIYHVA